jgi:16S rRNA (cytidine1402-2'-O)-methyltransferase
MPSKSASDASEGAERSVVLTPGLYLVATPIGNLGDVTLRAIEVLRAADAVVAEDTRHSRELLAHLGIAGKPLISINANSSERAIERVAARAASGAVLAYVTDAGMPGISDPGRALVDACTRHGAATSVVPGASALTAAVALSGLVDAAFHFIGFLPRRGGSRRRRLEAAARSHDAVVLFESPQRMQATLRELSELCPERAAFVGRELTKRHEEGARGSVAELAGRADWRGEIVLVLGPGATADDPILDLRRALACTALELAIEHGASPAHAARRLAEVSGMPRRELYARALELSRDRESSTDQPVGAPPETALERSGRHG